MPEHDPMDALRRAWKDLRPPEPAEDLKDADPTTRMVLERLQAAWQRVEPPARALPPAPGARTRPWLQPAAAALLAAALLAGVWSALSGTGEVTGPMQPEDRQPEREPPAPVVLASGEDRVVMRSGPVTLLLVRAGPGGDQNGIEQGDSDQ